MTGMRAGRAPFESAEDRVGMMAVLLEMETDVRLRMGGIEENDAGVFMDIVMEALLFAQENALAPVAGEGFNEDMLEFEVTGIGARRMEMLRVETVKEVETPKGTVKEVKERAPVRVVPDFPAYCDGMVDIGVLLHGITRGVLEKMPRGAREALAERLAFNQLLTYHVRSAAILSMDSMEALRNLDHDIMYEETDEKKPECMVYETGAKERIAMRRVLLGFTVSQRIKELRGTNPT